jgi:hypothetical protein
MKTLQPELFGTTRPDAIDQAIEEKLTAGPRCVHCGLIPVKHHADMCLTCVKKLVYGLRRSLQWKR